MLVAEAAVSRAMAVSHSTPARISAPEGEEAAAPAVMAVTEAELVVPDNVPEMKI